MSDLCPCCHSFDNETLRAAWHRGMHRTGAFNSSNGGNSTAASIAPPRKRRTIVLLVMLVMVITALAMRIALAAAGSPHGPERLGLASSVAGGLILLVAILWGLIRAERYNRTEWRAAMSEWEASFRCRACGFIFAPERSGNMPLQITRACAMEENSILPQA